MGSLDLLIIFNWTKTIQFGQHKLNIPMVAIAQSALCPVVAYKCMCHLVTAPKEGLAFVLQHRMCLSPVTYSQYQAVIHKVVSRVRLDPNFFPRIALDVVVPPGLSSDAYLKYLEFSLDQILVMAQTMAEGLY